MDINRALAEISAMRSQMARSSKFRGYGPATIAVTGLIGLFVGTIQARLLSHPSSQIDSYLALWIFTAAVAVATISLEATIRTFRIHRWLAKEMILGAAMHFVPPIAAGVLLTAVLLHSSPQSAWMLPGLWQIMFSLGVFSSSRLLPRPIVAVGTWYLACGLLILATGSPDFALSGPAMGVPFGVGQLLVAAILHREYMGSDENEEYEA